MSSSAAGSDFTDSHLIANKYDSSSLCARILGKILGLIGSGLTPVPADGHSFATVCGMVWTFVLCPCAAHLHHGPRSPVEEDGAGGPTRNHQCKATQFERSLQVHVHMYVGIYMHVELVGTHTHTFTYTYMYMYMYM